MLPCTYICASQSYPRCGNYRRPRTPAKCRVEVGDRNAPTTRQSIHTSGLCTSQTSPECPRERPLAPSSLRTFGAERVEQWWKDGQSSRELLLLHVVLARYWKFPFVSCRRYRHSGRGAVERSKFRVVLVRLSGIKCRPIVSSFVCVARRSPCHHCGRHRHGRIVCSEPEHYDGQYPCDISSA